jgi:hypothetical protein
LEGRATERGGVAASSVKMVIIGFGLLSSVTKHLPETI